MWKLESLVIFPQILPTLSTNYSHIRPHTREIHSFHFSFEFLALSQSTYIPGSEMQNTILSLDYKKSSSDHETNHVRRSQRWTSQPLSHFTTEAFLVSSDSHDNTGHIIHQRTHFSQPKYRPNTIFLTCLNGKICFSDRVPGCWFLKTIDTNLFIPAWLSSASQ